MPEFEARASDNSATVRVLAEDEREAGELASQFPAFDGKEVYVYAVEVDGQRLPVGYEGTDAEGPE